MFSFRSILRKTQRARFEAPIAPERPFVAIGDIHGAYSGMERILRRIDETLQDEAVVCVGDYVDRGERSAEVLDWLRQVNVSHPDDFHCLMGNHEHMMVQFLSDPGAYGDRWLAFGGLQTLLSYGVRRAPGMTLEEVRDQLAEAMGDDMIAWLRGLPSFWISGNMAVTHAGADPSLPIAEQPRRNLIWGHPDFDRVTRRDGIWVIHGHTIVEEPGARDGRISIDTGAYVTGRLTGALVRPGEVSFISS